jgi:hypothetical protein
MISKEILRNAGYCEWKEDHFQKRLDDEVGIKYFINIHRIELSNNALHTIWYPSIQIETSNGAVEIELVQWFNNDGETSGNTIKDVENYFERIWNFHGMPYYEKK